MDKLIDFSQFKQGKEKDENNNRYYELFTQAVNNGLEEEQQQEFVELHRWIQKENFDNLSTSMMSIVYEKMKEAIELNENFSKEINKEIEEILSDIHSIKEDLNS